MRPGGGFGVLCSFVHRTVEGQLVVLIVVDVADVPEDEEEEQSDAIGCTGLRAGRALSRAASAKRTREVWGRG